MEPWEIRDCEPPDGAAPSRIVAFYWRLLWPAFIAPFAYWVAQSRSTKASEMFANIWNRSAKWKWLEFIIIGLWVAAITVDEYMAAIVFAFVAAFGALSRIHHSDGKRWRKAAGTIGIGAIWLWLTAISAAKLGEKPASNVIVLWDRYVILEKMPIVDGRIPSYPPNFAPLEQPQNQTNKEPKFVPKPAFSVEVENQIFTPM